MGWGSCALLGVPGGLGGPGGGGRLAVYRCDRGCDWGCDGREAFALAVDVIGEVADDCAGDGIDGGWTALEDDGGAGLCAGGFADDDEAAAGAIGGLAIAEPGGEGNASGVFDGFVGKVEDDGGEASGLKKEIGCAKGLVEDASRVVVPLQDLLSGERVWLRVVQSSGPREGD